MQKASLVLALLMASSLFCGVSRAGEADARPDFRNMSAEERTKWFTDRQKERLGVNDEEFKALQPKIEAVQKAQNDARGGGFGGFGGGFGGGGFGGGQGGQGGRNRGGRGGAPGGAAADGAAAPEKSDVQTKTEALQKLLDNKDSDAKDVTAALKDLRDARQKAKDSLKKAQDALKELLTVKQEAYFVLRNQLE